MSQDLPPIPYKQPLMLPGGNGLVSPVWADWFTKAYARLGGPIAPVNGGAGSVTTSMLANGAVTAAKIAAAVAGSGLTGGAGAALAVNPDTTTLSVVGGKLQANIDNSTIAQSGATFGVPNGGLPFAKLLASDWTATQATTGYQKLGSGLYVQWDTTGSFTSGTTNAVTFPVAFPNNCFQVVAGIQGNSASSTAATGHWGTGGYSKTGFSLYNRTSLTFAFNYFAVGN